VVGHVRRGRLLAWPAWRGSVRAGVLTFTADNYAIYTLSIHVGPLFLAWVAVLGLTLWSLVGGLRALRPTAVAAELAAAPRRVVGWYLIAIAGVFSLLWLSDVVPAMIEGRIPQGALDLGLPSNPVHVLVLAIFLPAVIAIGRLVLLRRPTGLAPAPAAVVFLVMTGLPILVTPFVTAARGGEPAWPPASRTPVEVTDAVECRSQVRSSAVGSQPWVRRRGNELRGCGTGARTGTRRRTWSGLRSGTGASSGWSWRTSPSRQ
jgi:hypothetical protein